MPAVPNDAKLQIGKVDGGQDLQGEVVRKNFPDQVLKRLKVVNTKTHELIQEFWYNDKTDVVYSDSRISEDAVEEDEKMKYARVIGLDSLQLELSGELISACLTVAGMTSQLAFVADLWNTPKHVSHQRDTLRVAYTAVFFVGFTAQCLAVLCDTLQHMRSSRFRADAWTKGSCFESVKTFFKIYVLNFLGVIHTIKTIPIILHPRKGVQPFAAFKARDMRMFAVGWPSKIMYSYERDRGKQTGHLRVVIFALPLFLLQVILGAGLRNMNYMESLSGVLTMGQVMRSFVAYIRIKCQEVRAKQYLRLMTEEKLNDSTERQRLKRDTGARREVIVNYRLREEYFNEVIPDEVLEWARKENMAGTKDDEEAAKLLCTPLLCDCDEQEHEIHDQGPAADEFSDSDFSETSALCSPKRRSARC